MNSKLNTKEVIYDSQKELYEENVNKIATGHSEFDAYATEEELYTTKKPGQALQQTKKMFYISLHKTTPGYIY